MMKRKKISTVQLSSDSKSRDRLKLLGQACRKKFSIGLSSLLGCSELIAYKVHPNGVACRYAAKSPLRSFLVHSWGEMAHYCKCGKFGNITSTCIAFKFLGRI